MRLLTLTFKALVEHVVWKSNTGCVSFPGKVKSSFRETYIKVKNLDFLKRNGHEVGLSPFNCFLFASIIAL